MNLKLNRDKLKILFWDTNGFCLYYRRLEKGHFMWPKPEKQGAIHITKQQLSWLLSGLSLDPPNARYPLNGLEV
ncbi:IS66 family insertion sequence element accessory protein TnpB [Psychromonas arctica]|uniref:IS66 family insertion sequence element accessory protein TnpB n=1 Tax=Psychromonas arctica TaxID=168275 RepID=UPI001FE174A1|nr:IS66 family insertion sequence element accessory protein TnpB [Psychromonas arctica]